MFKVLVEYFSNKFICIELKLTLTETFFQIFHDNNFHSPAENINDHTESYQRERIFSFSVEMRQLHLVVYAT